MKYPFKGLVKPHPQLRQIHITRRSHAVPLRVMISMCEQYSFHEILSVSEPNSSSFLFEYLLDVYQNLFVLVRCTVKYRASQYFALVIDKFTFHRFFTCLVLGNRG
jgi:hypothetical protein